MTDAHGIARDQLRAFIERIERLEEEKKTISDDIKDVYGEAKGMGFIPAMIKKVVALRKKDEQQRMEEEAILDTYLSALGMLSQHDLFEETPAATDTAVGSGRGSAAPLRVQPETVTELHDALVPTRGEHPAIASSEHRGSHGQAAGRYPESQTDGTVTVTVVGTESGTVFNSPSDDDAIAAVNGKAGLANVIDVEPSSSVQIDPSEDRSEGQSLGGGMSSADANTGGDHVTAPQYAATHQAGGLVQNPPAKPLRPHCLRPENCGGYGSNHCFSCKKAATADEVAV